MDLKSLFVLLLVLSFSEFGLCVTDVRNQSTCNQRIQSQKGKDVTVVCNGTSCSYPNLPTNITDFICVGNKNLSTDLSFLCYKNFTRLRRINLSKNNLKMIPRECFRTFPNLQTLILSENRYLGLQNFYNACAGLNKTNITIIIANNINQVDILYPLNRTLSDFLSNTSLKEFHFEYNEISVLEENFLKRFPHTVEIVSVRGNRLRLDSRLAGLKSMSSLKSLDISFQCTTMQSLRRNEETGMQQKMNCSTSTNTEDHILKILPPSLEKLLSRETGSGSYCLPKLSFNKTNLRYLDISGASYFSWEGPIDFSDNFNYLETLILSNNKCSRISSKFFSKLNKLKVLDISYNVLGVFFPKVEGGAVFEGLTSLKTLDMSGNFINHIPPDLLKHQSNLEELILSLNDLEVWTLDIKHMSKLKFINCSYNRLVSLPESLQSNLDAIAEDHGISIAINNNKVLCNCENLQFISWMIKTDVEFSMGSKRCTKSDGSLIDIWEANDILKTNCGKTEWVFATVPSLLVFCFASVLGFLLYRKRWTITYRWYLFRLRHKGYTPIAGENDEHEYDAFLSFAEEDKNFVYKIVGELENCPDERYELCFHHRDFTPGVSIERNIVSAIHSSRKTIIFMSNSYVKSSWCNYELRMSMTKEGQTNRRVIVMVILDSIPRKKLPLEVMQYYKKNCYIEKPDKDNDLTVFIKTLKESLKN